MPARLGKGGDEAMNCSYCGAQNTDDDHRCHRCGRRLYVAAARPAPNPYPLARTSAAPAFDARLAPAPPEAPPPPAKQGRRTPYQAPLFPVRELPRLVPFESIAPKRQRQRRTTRPRPKELAAARASRAVRLNRLAPTGQQSLDFEGFAQLVKELGK